jgi:C1A family cysteine protease
MKENPKIRLAALLLPVVMALLIAAVTLLTAVTGLASAEALGSNVEPSYLLASAPSTATDATSTDEALPLDANGVAVGDATDCVYSVMEYIPPMPDPAQADPKPEVVQAPSSFSWRDYDGGDWTTPVKNQGSCGSCWDFAAVGALEAVINIDEGNPNLDLDLSEQYVLSCLSAAGSCAGGNSYLAFQYMKSEGGIIPESCFPYQGNSSISCSNKCSDWESQLIPISGCGYWYPSLPSDIDAIKSQLISKGPLVTYMTATSAFMSWGQTHHSSNDYYPNPGPVGSPNHAVVIVGYKDDPSIGNGGYWIIKNSWGTGFGYGGFYNVEYDSLHHGETITYVEYKAGSIPSGNNPPTAPVVDVTPNTPLTTDDLVCTITTPSTDPDGDAITYTYRWYRNGTLQRTTTTTALSNTLPSSLTDNGDVWKCVVTPNDGTVDGPSGEDQVTIHNDPPTAPVVDVTPDMPLSTDNLVCSVTTRSTDPDGDTITYTYRWYKNGTLQRSTSTTALSDTLPAALTGKGQVWKCVVTPNDGIVDGSSDEDQVTIQNSPPTAPVVNITPDEPLNTDDLVCTVTTRSTDPDGDTITYTYRWYKNGVLQKTTTTTALSDTLPASSTARGQVWKCVVTPSDGTINGPSGEDEVNIQNNPPTAPVVDITPNVPFTTDDLVCTIITQSTDAEGDAITYTYRWYRDGALERMRTTTALSDTLSSDSTVRDEIWRCVVTPNDTFVDGPSGEDQVTIQNSPPTAPVVEVTPDMPFTTDDLVCTITTQSTDADGDAITYTYRWYKNGTLQRTTMTTALSDTLSSASTAKGEVWRCVVTPNDGTLDGPSDDDQVTIQNSPPAAPVVDVTPHMPFTTDDLVCAITTPSTDPDGDAITYTYQWYKDGALQKTKTTTALSDKLTSASTAKGEVWECVVTPNDGTLDGPSDEDQVTIQNSPPTAPVVDVRPHMPFTTDDLTCTITIPSTDPDGDAITYTYQWYKDGGLQKTTVTTALSDTVSSASTSRGEVWECVVTPDDTFIEGASDDDQVTIQNSRPTAVAVDITPGMPFTTDDLVCTIITQSTDADGDAITYNYQWYKDGVLQKTMMTTALSDTLSSALTAKDEVWQCVVTPTDGTLDGLSDDDQVTIQNSPPTAPAVNITPDMPLATDDLVCTVITQSTDADGDVITYTYQWYKDGVLQQTTTTAALSDMLSSALTERGETWECVVTPSDGTVDGPSVTVVEVLSYEAITAEGGWIETIDEQVAMEFPSDIVTGTAKVAINQVSASSLPLPPDGCEAGNTGLIIDMVNAQGAAISTLAEDMTIVVRYSEEDLAAAEGNPRHLALAYYDEASGQWEILDTNVDINDGTISATANHLSRWMVLAKTPPDVDWMPVGLAGGSFLLFLMVAFWLNHRLARKQDARD